jgi:hypothetical protein
LAIRFRMLLVCTLVLGTGCNPLRPSCTGESGPLPGVTGTVGAGQIAVHRLTYGTQGSQNDLRVSWIDQGLPGGPQLQFYATLASCEDFSPASASGACEILARAGSTDGGPMAFTMVVTHGRGNPGRLGAAPEFKLWVVGDVERTADYTVTAVWRLPIEC